MMLFLSRFAVLVGFLAISSAHFILNYPPSIGFDDDAEGEGPCGGFSIPSASDTNGTSIPVSGFPIWLQSTHPQSSWLFRASTDRTTSNWTNLEPIIQQTGLGDFCLPHLSLPEEFVGKTGLIQIMGDAVDGFLYQCAAVTFVSGTNTSVSCSNATGVTATLTNQQSFNASVSSSASAIASTMTSTATTTGTATVASTTSSHTAGTVAMATAVVGFEVAAAIVAVLAYVA